MRTGVRIFLVAPKAFRRPISRCARHGDQHDIDDTDGAQRQSHDPTTPRNNPSRRNILPTRCEFQSVPVLKASPVWDRSRGVAR